VNDRIAIMAEAYRQARARLCFLDSNLWIGRPVQPEFNTLFDLDTLRRRMTRYQIQGGVVSNFAAKDYGPAWGNDEVLNLLAGTGLWAGIVLVPEMFDPESAGRAYLSECIARGARLARVFPKSHNFTLRAWCSGALLQALADSRLPLVVWHTEVAWDEICSLCETYPDLTVIVEGTGQKILYHSRVYYPLLERYPNLRLELHNLATYLGVEDLVRRFGARRLIFGSYMPVFDPNATLMQVTHARISEEDKQLIAGQNLAELVARVRKL
jgi:predicted TIM-barrel fold metal-dependent hydrolase